MEGCQEPRARRWASTLYLPERMDTRVAVRVVPVLSSCPVATMDCPTEIVGLVVLVLPGPLSYCVVLVSTMLVTLVYSVLPAGSLSGLTEIVFPLTAVTVPSACGVAVRPV